jgi:hypothetical protein
MKQIFIPNEIKREMIETFKTTDVTLWSALTFRTKSKRANKLRIAALERGGVIYPCQLNQKMTIGESSAIEDVISRVIDCLEWNEKLEQYTYKSKFDLSVSDGEFESLKSASQKLKSMNL